MLLHMVNQNVQEWLKKFQDKKIKNMRKHTKNEIIGALNKYEIET
jgi:hypothetical protein